MDGGRASTCEDGRGGCCGRRASVALWIMPLARFVGYGERSRPDIEFHGERAGVGSSENSVSLEAQSRWNDRFLLNKLCPRSSRPPAGMSCGLYPV